MNGLPEKPAVSPAVVLETVRSLLAERGEVTLPAVGFSMGPRFQAAESLVIRSCPSSHRLLPGAVVVFERHGRWVAHRLWMTWGPLCVTGGDATWTLDEPSPRREAIEGVVVALCENGQRHELESAPSRWRWPRWWMGGVFRLLIQRVIHP